MVRRIDVTGAAGIQLAAWEFADPPKGARGLSVPAMPVGTPGMEQGDRFDPYSVMLITKGEPRVFAKVSSPADQEV